MKKIAIITMALSSFAMAGEVNVKTGYESQRVDKLTIGVNGQSIKATENIVPGFVGGVEYIPFNKGLFELGIGVEAKLGTPFGEYKALGAKYSDAEPLVTSNLYTFPVYALGKFNLFKSEDNNYSHYVLGRFGYAPSFIHAKIDDLSGEEGETNVNISGLYYGTGIGVDLGPVTIEAVYDGIYRSRDLARGKYEVLNIIIDIKFEEVPNTSYEPITYGFKSLRHSFGLRFGVKLGDYRTPKKMEVQPVVVEEVVAPVVVEEPVVLPTPTPAPKRQLIHASCADGKCIIHGFEIDGRVPSKEEQRNIQEIVQQVNDFALSGQVAVVGHTDATGSEAYNQKLSEKRASNVVKLLQEAGLKPEIQVMSITGKGELAPMDTNKTKTGRYNNRRVEIIFEQIEQ